MISLPSVTPAYTILASVVPRGLLPLNRNCCTAILTLLLQLFCYASAALALPTHLYHPSSTALRWWSCFCHPVLTAPPRLRHLRLCRSTYSLPSHHYCHTDSVTWLPLLHCPGSTTSALPPRLYHPSSVTLDLLPRLLPCIWDPTFETPLFFSGSVALLLPLCNIISTTSPLQICRHRLIATNPLPPLNAPSVPGCEAPSPLSCLPCSASAVSPSLLYLCCLAFLDLQPMTRFHCFASSIQLGHPIFAISALPHLCFHYPRPCRFADQLILHYRRCIVMAAPIPPLCHPRLPHPGFTVPTLPPNFCSPVFAARFLRSHPASTTPSIAAPGIRCCRTAAATPLLLPGHTGSVALTAKKQFRRHGSATQALLHWLRCLGFAAPPLGPPLCDPGSSALPLSLHDSTWTGLMPQIQC